MEVIKKEIPDVMLLEPTIYEDDRGLFFESYNKNKFKELTGVKIDFVQDNHSSSIKNVLRGLHYQIQMPQGKLVRVIVGEIYDVAVDIRRKSSTFGQWTAEYLSAENKKQIWIPIGFAHGFLIISDYAEVLYKTTDYYAPEHERCIVWNDPDLNIEWPIEIDPELSGKDSQGLRFKNIEIVA